MIRQTLRRPSLKITRHTNQTRSSSFSFEVWSPFTADYQPVESVEAGLRRVDQLAGVICQMWLQRHPMQNALTDTPNADNSDTAEWAEFRINATTYRTYDTRRHDSRGWARATGLTHATEATCARVGYALSRSKVP
jgi:hypothetical protein